MSIIYDALQKTQRNISDKNSLFVRTNSRLNWLDIVLLIIVFSLLTAVIALYFPQLKKMTFYTAKPKVVSMKQASPIRSQPPALVPQDAPYAGKLVLNGVFLSDQENVALINNRMFHVGDMLNGMKVTSISIDHVQLSNNISTITLHAGA